MMAVKEDPRPAFDYAMRNCPQKIQVTLVEDVLLGSTRGNEAVGKAPAMELELTPEQAKNLRGDAARRDLLLLIRIPRDVVDRSKSSIILPGEA
jgi:hypothetical protein